MAKIANVDGLIIDMDGVLWHGNDPINGLVEFFISLRELAIPFVLATNNASLTQQQYIDKLTRMGVEVIASEVLTSSMATARYLAQHLKKEQRRIFVIGEAGLRQPLLEQGFTLSETYTLNPPDKEIDIEPVDAVVSGLDRQLTWNKMATATLHLNAGAAFFATNSDTTLPTEKGNVIGNGGVLAALTAVTGVKPISIGKPEPILYQYALDVLGCDAKNTIAIGDRLDTDILGAVNAGMRSILVLTGISTQEDIANVDYQPTWIMKDISEVAQTLEGITQ